ncbi:MAG: T9SS type A sorting domain-containing protein, partial [Bacteroidetes bacterium]|nr:T9SS type A sorting domain-containing protein [Bacteroidota bacterium]
NANNSVISGRFYNSNHTPASDELQFFSGNLNQLGLDYWKNGKYIISYVLNSSSSLQFLIAENGQAPGSAISVSTNVDSYDTDTHGDSLAVIYSSSTNGQAYLRGYNMETNAWFNNAVLVSEDGSSDYSQPNVVYHPSGRLTVIYHYYINTSGCCTYDRRIYRKTFSSSFLAEIPEHSIWTINSEQNVGSDLHAEGNNLGEVIITTTHGTTASSRYMRLWILNAQGTAVVNNEVLLSGGGNDWYGDIEGYLYDNGNYVIGKTIRTGGFQNPNGTEAYVIYGENYSESNSGILQMNSTSAGEQRNTCIAPLPGGGFVAAWCGNGFQGDDQGVYSRAYNAVAFPGVLVQPQGTLQTSETGGNVEVLVSLATAPSSAVSIEISSSDETEGTVSTQVINFTSGTWNVPVSVIISGEDDAADDGNVNYSVTFSSAGSADATYSTLSNHVLTFTNLDDDASLTVPENQSFCRSEGIEDLTFEFINAGSTIESISVSSSNQNVVEDDDISYSLILDDVYSLSINNLNNNQNGTSTITITFSDGNFEYSDSFTVTTSGAEVNVLATETEVCQGEEVTLLALGIQNIMWDNGVQNNVAFVPEETTTYTVSGDDGSGCSAQSSIEIIVNPAPATPEITAFAGNLVSSAVNNNQWYLDGELIEGATNQLITPVMSGDYTVVVSNGNCSAVSEPFEVIITSILSAQSANLQLFPNPATDYLYVSGLPADAQLTIIDLSGRHLADFYGTSVLPVSNLRTGMYILIIETNHSKEVFKFSVK